MKAFAGILIGVVLAGAVYGLGRRQPQPSLPDGFPAKGTFVLVDVDGRVRFDLELERDSIRSFTFRITDAADSVRSVSERLSSRDRKVFRIGDAGGRPFRAGDRVTVILDDGRSREWRYTPYLR